VRLPIRQAIPSLGLSAANKAERKDCFPHHIPSRAKRRTRRRYAAVLTGSSNSASPRLTVVIPAMSACMVGVVVFSACF
jgi:hypothetical protein